MRLTTLRYLWITLVHKWFVFVAGRRLGVPLWQLIIHDWTKFTPAEAPYYGRQFFGSIEKRDPTAFQGAWRHHYTHNRHHWEYWVNGAYKYEMPEHFAREMVADWFAVSRAYEGAWPSSRAEWPWLQKNWTKIRLHPKTRVLVDAILTEAFAK